MDSAITTPSSLDSSTITEQIFLKHSALRNGATNASTPSLLSIPQLPNLRDIYFLGRFLPSKDPKQLKYEELKQKQSKATTYKQWAAVGLELDAHFGNEAWKRDPKLDCYDLDLLQRVLDRMRYARENKDYKLLLYIVRTSWVRNLGNMGDLQLYKQSYFGTKHLIEEYIAECELALNYLVNDELVLLDKRYILGMLIQTRKNIGRTALVLSGGSTFGIFHIGVLALLLECNLMPRIVSGSLAGLIMASILCCLTNEEMLALLETISDTKFEIFGSEDIPDDNHPESTKAWYQNNDHFSKHESLRRLAHFLKYGTFFDNSGLKKTIIGFIGEITFREAYNRTGKILNITVSPASIHEQTRLLNYLTAPNCLIWLAVCASCSVPGFFPSASIFEKNPRTGVAQEWNNDSLVKYVDGSVDNDLPITRLSEMFNVDHIIAVQVNPHVVPFLKLLVTNVGGGIENAAKFQVKKALASVYGFMSRELVHYLEVLHECGIWQNLTTKAILILSQQYSGDITILPDFNIHDFTKVFTNPTPEFLLECIVRGARASWPKITLIKNHCGVEFALDKAITTLRGRLISTQKDKSVSIAPTVSVMGNTDNYSLVASPKLSDDAFDSPIPNIERQVPVRHHSVANYRTLKGSSSRRNPKRNSILLMGGENSKLDVTPPKFGKGKSTTSLFTLDKRTNSDLFAKKTPSWFSSVLPEKAHQSTFNSRSSNTAHSFSEITDEFGHEEDGLTEQLLDGVHNRVRKAKSSGNFYTYSHSDENDQESNQLRYDIDRIPFHEANPYIDQVTKNEAQPFLNKDIVKNVNLSNGSNSPILISLSANLPSKRGSTSNSLRNSVIGLNRLKDYSRDSSYVNLRDSFDDENSLQKHLMELTSPDIRRQYRGKRRSPSRVNSGEIPLLMKKLAKEQQSREETSNTGTESKTDTELTLKEEDDDGYQTDKDSGTSDYYKDFDREKSSSQDVEHAEDDDIEEQEEDVEGNIEAKFDINGESTKNGNTNNS